MLQSNLKKKNNLRRIKISVLKKNFAFRLLIKNLLINNAKQLLVAL